MVPEAMVVKEISLRKQTGIHLSRNGTHVRQWLTYIDCKFLEDEDEMDLGHYGFSTSTTVSST